MLAASKSDLQKVEEINHNINLTLTVLLVRDYNFLSCCPSQPEVLLGLPYVLEANFSESIYDFIC